MPIAQLNVARYAAWQPEPTADNSKPAALAFDGDVYDGLDANTLKTADLAWAQEHAQASGARITVTEDIAEGVAGAGKPFLVDTAGSVDHMRRQDIERIGGLAAPLIIGFTYARIGVIGVFTITTIVLVLGALAVAVLGQSTAGKSLEQISGKG